MRARPNKEKRLRRGGVGPLEHFAKGRVTTIAPLQKETPLSGRRANDAIAGGVRVQILLTSGTAVKRLAHGPWDI